MSQNYYLKVAFQHKIKKYAISSPHQINFAQIKHHLSLNQSTKYSLFYYQFVQDFTGGHSDTSCLFKEEEILQHLTRSVIQPNSTIKLRIFQRTLMSEEERRRKESYESLEIPTTFEKKRSKSMEFQLDVFDQTCQTQCFDQTTNFILPSNQRDSQISPQNKQTNPSQPQSFSDVDKRKFFSKSAQFCIATRASFSQQNSNMISSLRYSIDLNQIRNSLHESMKATVQQKNELEKLKQKIARREKQKLIQKQNQKKQLNDILILFGIQPKLN